MAESSRLFAHQGYDETTIRGIAAAAGADPSLVIRYFKSKEGLFAEVAKSSFEESHEHATEGLPDRLLESLREKIEDEPLALLAVLRSMFSQPVMAEEFRRTLRRQQHLAASELSDDQASLRASLVGALMLGVVVGRYVVQLDGLRDADASDLIDLLRPCLGALLDDA